MHGICHFARNHMTVHLKISEWLNYQYEKKFCYIRNVFFHYKSVFVFKVECYKLYICFTGLQCTISNFSMTLWKKIKSLRNWRSYVCISRKNLILGVFTVKVFIVSSITIQPDRKRIIRLDYKACKKQQWLAP